MLKYNKLNLKICKVNKIAYKIEDRKCKKHLKFEDIHKHT